MKMSFSGAMKEAVIWFPVAFSGITVLFAIFFLVCGIVKMARASGKSLTPLRYEHRFGFQVKHYRETNTGTCWREDLFFLSEEDCAASGEVAL